MKLYIKITIVLLISVSISSILLVTTLPADAVAINSDVGLTPFKGQVIIRSQFRALRLSDDSTFFNDTGWVLAVPNTIVYGFTEKLSGLVTLPWSYRNLAFSETNRKVIRRGKGIGDISLLGKYRLFTKDYPGATSRLALVSGIEIPTGEIGDRDKFGKLPRPLQDGTGSWNPIVGAAYTYLSLNDEWDLNLTYKFDTERSGFEFGDELKYNIAYQRRILPWKIPSEGVYKQLNLVLEANGIWDQKIRENGKKTKNSGSNVMFLSPGIQFVTKHAVAEFSVQLPALQVFSGSQLRPDVSLVSSLRLTF